MGWVKIGAWAFAIVVGLLTGYLAYLNRGSEKVAANLPTALAVSAVGALLTLLFSLQPAERSTSFPVEYVLDPKTVLPLSCEAFPECTSYTDAGGASVFGAWTVIDEITQGKPVAVGDNLVLSQLYRDVLVRQLLDTLRFTYLKSWDAQPSRFELPTGGGHITYAARAVWTGRKLGGADLVAACGGSPGWVSSKFEFLNLPPNTDVSGVTQPESFVLRLRNAFSDVSLEVTSRGVESGLGPLRELCHIGFEAEKDYWRPRYSVALSATFSTLRSGHPEMPLYKHWVDTMIGEIERFDSVRRWAALRDQYLLIYAHRTRTPLQELMEETVRKAELKK